MFPLAKPTEVPIPKLLIFGGQETNSEKMRKNSKKRYKGHTHPKLYDLTFAAYLLSNLYTVFFLPKIVMFVHATKFPDVIYTPEI